MVSPVFNPWYNKVTISVNYFCHYYCHESNIDIKLMLLVKRPQYIYILKKTVINVVNYCLIYHTNYCSNSTVIYCRNFCYPKNLFPVY